MWPVATVFAVVTFLLWSGDAPASDAPTGRLIAEVLPVGNRVRTPEQIRSIMYSRPGVRYEETTLQEDVRRLHNTKWFIPGGVQILTRNEPDGRVTILVYVTELSNVVQDVQYVGAQHLRASDLQNLSGVRKGEPMNPLANELGRQSIQRRYQDDGRYYATVELVEGNKPTDTRVVYQIVEGPVVKVAGIDFRGVDQASESRLRTQLVTRKQFIGFFGGKFNPVSIDLDRQRIVEYYHGLGYLNVQVTPEVERTKDIGLVRIVYHISEGRQYHVTGKEIVGAKSFTPDKLDTLTELKQGDRYDLRTVQADTMRIKDYYGARGYPVGVEQRLYEVPGQPGAVQVNYEVQNDRGQPDRVGRIIVEGNDVTKNRVIWNQLPFRPGQVLPYDRLDEARMRLARLGVFDAEDPPTVEVVPNELDSLFKDIRIRVKETRTGQFMVGGSVNSDMGLTGNITINERNFSLTRWPTSWDDFRNGRAFRGDGQELRIEAAPGTIFQRYSVTWREPYLLDTPFGLTVSGYYFNRAFAEYNEDRYGTRITVDRRLDPIWRASLMTRIEGINISDVPGFAPQEIAEDAGGHFLLGLRPGLTRDTRDSYVYPTRGSVFDVGFEQVFGDNTFPIGTVEMTKFFSTRYLAREDGSGRHVLGLRTQVSVAGGNAPVYERFYGGGIRSFRGFTFRGLGPFENDLAVGGTFSWLNTAEYQIPLFANDKFHWAFFVDHGTVERNVSIHNYRVAVGTGIRLSIPALGPLPLAIDLAVPLTKGPDDRKQLVNFSVGVFGGP
jgi:outer membrane protein insertion porin family